MATSVWVAAPTRAIWIPAGCWHQYSRLGSGVPESTFARAGVETAAGSALPVEPCAVHISRAFAAALPHLSGARIGASGVELRQTTNAFEHWVPAADGQHAEAVRVFCEGVKDEGMAALASPFPGRGGCDARLRPLLDSVRRDPAAARTLVDWARILRLSPATVNRALQRETGLSFGAWRRQVRLLDATERLALGQSVPRVARCLGYRSTAKFAAMFERVVGIKPAEYFAPSFAAR
jgi:AraC-like DNA-binding protein